MNKSQLRDFAIRSRVTLINSVKLRAYAYGITDEKVKAGTVEPSDKALNSKGGLLSNAERLQRDQLLRRISLKGFAQVMEEAAYTWFNRFIALRYMENAQLLPLPQRVFAQAGEARPEILADALHVDLDGLDKEQVITLLEGNENEALYKLLLITLTNSLHAVLPQMFERISDYTELLFPDGLLQKDSVLAEMAKLDSSNWQDIQVIGWMYQYYNTELKDETFALLKKNVKITKERIGAATQLFTPEWIVRYMVENSLGRLWLEGHADEALQGGWKYYLPEAEQEPDVAAKLKELRKDAASLRPEEITVLDPCMGSGHILVAAFDVLMDIYRAAGYIDRDAVRAIVEHNLFGLDIDDRAAQLAYFAVMMTACKYDRRYLKRDNVPQPHVCAIQESNALTAFDNLHGQLSLDKLCIETANDLIRTFYDAKEYGSILDVKIDHLDSAEALMAQLHGVADADFELFGWVSKAEELLPQLVMQAEIMQRKYDVVITNPPYMGGSGMGEKLAAYVKDNYPDSKSDMFAVFIERCGQMTKAGAFQAMITQHAWMFLSSFEKLRAKLLKHDTVNMAHLGARAFEEIGGEVVQTTAFVMRNELVKGFKGTYCRLIEPTTQQGKEEMFLAGEKRFAACQDNFEKIPGAPVAYWVSEGFRTLFASSPLSTTAFAGIGMRTGDNERFLRLWHEVTTLRFQTGCANRDDALWRKAKWIPYNKGGEFRRWYGNNEYVVNWEDNGKEIKENTRRVYPQLGDNLGWKISNEQYYFHEGITWTVVSSKYTSFRRYYEGAIISNSGQSVIGKSSEDNDYLVGLLNSNVVISALQILSPTIGFESGYINKIPTIKSVEAYDEVRRLAIDCIALSRSDWDSFETSWDFKQHPMLTYARWTPQQIAHEASQGLLTMNTLQEAYKDWQNEADKRFTQLKANEEELNRIFIDIYGLQDELTPDVAEKDVTVYRILDDPNDEQRAMRYVLTRRDAMVSLISYAVGCMVGRYSLDVEGLAYAGGDWDASKYRIFQPDKDGILPISDDEYFEDDIVARFVQFVETVYGANTLEENLRFIADSLGGKGSPREVIRAYFLNDFYKDHLKTYQKRPIYWLFDSGKQNGFKALVYLHRYDRDTLARLRTDYVHPQQERLRTQIEGTQHTAQTGDARQRTVAAKRLDKLQKQLTELVKYEEQLHHLADERIALDLDDGVKVNYAKMGPLVAAIK